MARPHRACSSLLLFVAVITAGCGAITRVPPGSRRAWIASQIPLLGPTFQVPPHAAALAMRQRVNWLNAPEKSPLPEMWEIRAAMEPGERPPPLGAPDELIAAFLHASDAQIRDERLYERYEDFLKLDKLDSIVSVTVRNSLVERFDSFVLAATLAAYGNGCATGSRDFMIHTGDLLDISTATELADALNVLHAAQQEFPACPLYSVAGNHDGATFGNLPDKASDTRGLGVNRSEFVSGHLLRDPTNGFGFAANEVVSALDRLVPKKIGSRHDCRVTCEEEDVSLECWRNCMADQIDDLKDSRRDWAPRAGKDMFQDAAVLHEAAQVSGYGDNYGQQLGYYRIPAEGVRLRLLVLDTRSSDYVGGHLDAVQLGWLYSELRGAYQPDAQGNRDLVVLFAHHAPSDIGGEGGAALARMLEGFGNVIAYFHGHGHWSSPTGGAEGPQERPLVVETGSLADFPQVARAVRIYYDKESRVAKIWWQFVRPSVVLPGGPPEASQIAALLEASLSDARKEHDEGLPVPCVLKRSFGLVRPGTECAKVFGNSKQWMKEYLSEDGDFPGRGVTVSVKVDFAREAPSPQQIFESALDGIDERRRILDLPLVQP